MDTGNVFVILGALPIGAALALIDWLMDLVFAFYRIW